MVNLSIHEFNGKTIRIRKSDRYVCLTDIAIASNKKVNDWTRLNSTSDFLQALESVTGIPATEAIQTNQGGIPSEQGTWGHPKVAIAFAQWCSPRFAVQVSCWIDELMSTGRVAIAPVSEPSTPQSRQSKALVAAREVQEIRSLLSDNPRLCQFLVDHCVNEILELPALPAAEVVYRGVVEMAEEMGFKVDISTRSPLGKFVASQVRHLGKKEKRLCNGTMQAIYCYPDTEEVRSAIARFFN